MTIRTLIPTALLAAAGLALTTVSSQAQLSYSQGDLILGFEATSGTGSSVDYEVDIGNAASFASGGAFATGSPVELNLGSIGADLVATYGSSWFNNANLNWSIEGTFNTAVSPFAAKTSFATEPEPTVGTQSTPPVLGNASQRNTLSNNLNLQGTQYAKGTTENGSPAGTLAGGDQVASTNSTKALFQPTTLTNSFASFQPGTINSSYGYFTGGNFNSFSGGVNGSASDLYEINSSSVSYQGVFQFDNSGNLYYDSAAVSSVSFPINTPEPNSLSLLVLGAGLFFGLARRRTVAAA